MKNKKRSLGMLSLCLLSFLFLSGGLILGVTSALTLANIAAGGVISFEVSVSDESVYADLYFTCNSTTKTASVSAKSKTITGTDGTIEIPAKILHNGEVYDVTAIDAGAYTSSANKIGFYNCSSIKQIIIPDSIISIGNSSFYGSGLTSITVPKSVTSIGTGIFRACNSLSSIEVEDGNAIYYGKGNSIIESSTKTLIAGCKDTVIPTETLIIGTYAFADNTALTTITIPSNVTEIKSNAFYSCSGLTSVTIPGNVKTIGTSAFESCYKVSSITLNEGLQTIGSNAFYYCGSSSSAPIALTIPASVTSIASGNPFRFSSKITSITVASGNTKYYSSGNAIIETSTQKLIVGCKNSTIASTVKTIGGYAIYGMGGPTSITIPASVTTIEAYALGASYSWSLTSVTFANTEGWTAGTTAIESSDLASGSTAANTLKSNYSKKWTWADTVKDETEYSDLVFTQIGSTTNANVKARDTSTLSGDVVIPDKVKINGTNYNVTEIAANGFQNAVNVTSYTLPNTITKINNYGFAGGSNSSYPHWTTIDLPSSLVTIGDYAFFCCKDLSEFTIPNKVTSIGRAAFYNCTSLTSVEIPGSVKTIGYRAFYANSKLTSVTFNEGLETIENQAFADGSKLTELHLPASLKSFVGDYKLNTANLTSITVASGNTVYMASGNCLIEISTKTLILGSINSVIPTDASIVTTIGSNAFYGCILSSLTIPANITSIKTNAFIDAGASSVTFANTEGWTAGTTPLSMTDLANTATAGLYISKTSANGGYSDVDWTWTDPVKDESEYSDLVFTQIGSTTNANVKARSASTISGKVVIPDRVKINGVNYTVTEIAANGFQNAVNVTSYTLPDTITAIKDYGFAGSSSSKNTFTSINLPSGLASIGARAFQYCTGITSIDMPSSLTALGSYAFYNCSNLKSVNLSTGLTSIANDTFVSCGLTSITIPSNIKTLGSFAFAYCSYVTSLTLNEGLQTIGASVFSYCGSSTASISLTIPASVTSISGNPFDGSSAITSITVASGNTKYYSSGNAIIETSTQKLIVGCKNSTIASTVQTIAAGAFKNMGGPVSITIPASVTTIEANAFGSSSSSIKLTSVTFANTEGWSVDGTSLDSSLLASGSTAASTIKTNYNKKWTWTDPVKDESEYSDLVFTQIGSTTNANVKAKDASTISGAVVIPDRVKISGVNYTVTEIAANGFQNAVNVTLYTLPDTITAINDYAFAGSSSSKNTFTSINLPSNLTSIGASAFAHCTGITSIVLPSRVTSIGQGAFRGCTSLASVNILSNINEIKVSTFLYCASLENVTIPSSVTSIGASAFAYCTKLSDITIPSSVTSIGDNAFFTCTGLTTLTISSSVINYGTTVLAGCSSLTSLTLPYRKNEAGSTSFTCLGELWNSSATSSNQATYIPTSLKTIAINDFDNISEELLANLSFTILNIYHDDTRSTEGDVNIDLQNTKLTINFYNSGYIISNADVASNSTIMIYGGMSIEFGIIKYGGVDFYVKSGANPSLNGSVFYSDGSCYIEDETWLNNYERSKGLIENIDSFYYSKTSISDSNYSSYFKYTKDITSSTTTAIHCFEFNAPVSSVVREKDTYTTNGYVLKGANEVVGILNDRKFRKANDGLAYAFIVTATFQNTDGSTTEWRYPILVSGVSAEAVEVEAFYDGSWHGSGYGTFTLWGKTWWYSRNSAAWPSRYEDTSGGNRMYVNLPSSTIINESNLYLTAQTCLEEIFEEHDMSTYKTISQYKTAYDRYTSTDFVTSITSFIYRCKSNSSDTLTSCNVVFSGNYEQPYECDNSYLICAVDWEYATKVYNDLSFTYNTINRTASVKATSTSISGSVEIPSCVTYNGLLFDVVEIDDNGFKNCKSLTSVTIPETITSIGTYAFDGSGITSAVFKNPNGWIVAHYNPVALTDLADAASASAWLGYYVDARWEIANDASYYSDFTFTYDSSNKTATVAAANTSIAGNIVIPKVFVYNETIYKVTAIADNGFADCTNITGINIPDTVTTIGLSAFSKCKKLTAIEIPSGVSTINMLTFSGSGLTNIILPSGLKEIFQEAFSLCTSLESITLPSGLTTIGANAFLETTNLSSVIFENVEDWNVQDTLISSNDLSKSSIAAIYLQKIYCACVWTKDSLSVKDTSYYPGLSFTVIDSTHVSVAGNSSTLRITVPSKVRLNGSYYWVSKVADSGFSGYNMESIGLPSTITSIGASAFSGCTSLKYIILPESLIEIGEQAFYNCSSLEKIEMPTSLSSIGFQAFSGCTNLKSATFNDKNSWYVRKRNTISDSDDVSLDLSFGITGGNMATYLTGSYCTYKWLKK